MLGAIIGDIIGSKYEFNNIKTKKFKLFSSGCHYTDDSVLTIAVGKAIMTAEDKGTDLADEAVYWMAEFGEEYPTSYGERFKKWIADPIKKPYNSWGNGAAMRVSSAAESSLGSLEIALKRSDIVTGVTHNHWEGLKGARATTHAIWMAKNGAEKEDIRKVINSQYYPLDFTCDEIRKDYEFEESCQGTVPQAIEAFLESISFEDAIRIAVSLGGDSDTLAAITGSIAEAYYGIPEKLRKEAMSYLDETLSGIVTEFEERYKLIPTEE